MQETVMAFSPGFVDAWGEGFGAQPLGGPVQLTTRERQRRLVQAGGAQLTRPLMVVRYPLMTEAA